MSYESGAGVTKDFPAARMVPMIVTAQGRYRMGLFAISLMALTLPPACWELTDSIAMTPSLVTINMEK